MKNVLNAPERNYTFVLFLLSFLVTVALIVTAVYFNSLIPDSENEFLRGKIKSFENQIFEQQEYIATMRKIKALNDTLIKLDDVPSWVEREITNNLNVMNESKYLEGPVYGKLYTDILNIVYDYTETNKRQVIHKKEQQEVERLKSELERTKTDLESAQRSLDVYRQSANLGLGRQ